MGSAAKAVTKAVKKVSTTVKKVVKPVAGGVGKIASGKVSEGLGDISQTATTMGLDIATGGNKKIVDQLSGGLLSSTEQAARGNTKDIARVGVTGAATYVGGPAAGFAVNNVLSQGGNYAQALQAGGTGGEMSILSDVSGFLGSDSPFAALANNAISGLTASPKSAPRVVSQPAAQKIIQAPVKQGMSTGMIAGIAAAAIGAILILVLVLKKK